MKFLHISTSCIFLVDSSTIAHFFNTTAAQVQLLFGTQSIPMKSSEICETNTTLVALLVHLRIAKAFGNVDFSFSTHLCIAA